MRTFFVSVLFNSWIAQSGFLLTNKQEQEMENSVAANVE